MTEYASVTGVYVKQQQEEYQVYVRTKLTHSITPGWATKYDIAKAVTEKMAPRRFHMDSRIFPTGLAIM